ncbi:hypothetical protein B0H17DRAFT_1174545 [Mycena rosella]|uniref:Uncharacterized protein n=1 Tax=Mycena rosella TaxID=1033263 RepID=A0AAD7GXJ5_MYCRO|nr:hypothetical protein B0H17DRAFT_1174545 [Mycena rosella]
MFGMSARATYSSWFLADHIPAALKKAVAKRAVKKKQQTYTTSYVEPEPFDIFEYLASDDYAREFNTIPWPIYNKETWPSKWHHKCDNGFCGYPNHPSTEPGTFKCSHGPCDGKYTVTPEMAAAIGVQIHKSHCRRVIKTLPQENNTLLRGSGWSAKEIRMRPRTPSLESMATAPVRFPRAPAPPFVLNPLHPTAQSTRRPRPSLPASMELLRFPEQENRPPPLSANAPSVRRDYGPRPSLPGFVGKLHPFQESKCDPKRRPARPGPPPPNWI